MSHTDLEVTYGTCSLCPGCGRFGVFVGLTGRTSLRVLGTAKATHIVRHLRPGETLWADAEAALAARVADGAPWDDVLRLMRAAGMEVP